MYWPVGCALIHVHIQACDLKLMLTIMKKTGESVCVGGEGKCALLSISGGENASLAPGLP